MGWHGYWVSPGNWQMHHSHHPGHQRNSLSVSTPVHSSAAGECGLLPQHNEHRIRSSCSRCLTFCLVFTPAALCWWAKNNNSTCTFCRIVTFSHGLYMVDGSLKYIWKKNNNYKHSGTTTSSKLQLMPQNSYSFSYSSSAKVPLKLPGSGSWSGSAPKSNGLLLLRRPLKKFHNNSSTTFWDYAADSQTDSGRNKIILSGLII